MRLNRKILIISVMGLTLVQIPKNTSAKEQQNTTNNVHMIPASFADLAESLSPAVVNISTTQKTVVPEDFPEMPQFPEGSPFQDFFDEFMQRRGGGRPSRPATSLGSGFVIDAQNGYIITNNHVVRDAEGIRVTFPNEITLDAEIIGTDEKTDLAVLKVETESQKLTAVSFGNSNTIRVGDWTLAIGNPFGLGGTVTTGILSARARDIQSGPYDDYLQTDASINQGNSGGPLFNMNGEVIGINTAIFSPTGGSVGIGFAIPSALAKPVINQIIQYGHTKRGWLGVRIQSVTDEIAESLGLGEARGALIASVNNKGPAKAAGLKAGDIILEINEQKIKEMKSLPRIVAENDIGAKAKIKYWREEKEHMTEVIIGELEKAEKEGIIGSPEITSGTELEEFINDIRPASKADQKNLIAGSVIVEINQQPVKEPSEIVSIIEKAQQNNRKSVLLLVNENGKVRFVALRL